MVKEVKMFTVICDNCGVDVNDGAEYSCWNDEGYAEEIAEASGWITIEDKHYCPECFTFDDDDNLVTIERSGSA